VNETMSSPSQAFTNAILPQPLIELNWLEKELPNPSDQRAYAQERAIVVITEAIAEAMESAGLRRVDIAERLEKTKGHISQVLSGRRNMTLRTLGDVLWACGLELEDVKLEPLGQILCSLDSATEWRGLHDSHQVPFITIEGFSSREGFSSSFLVDTKPRSPLEILVQWQSSPLGMPREASTAAPIANHDLALAA
jgi:transcriptional regulator with XRE-family HTH domain